LTPPNGRCTSAPMVGAQPRKKHLPGGGLCPLPNVRKSSTEPLSPSVDAVDQEQRLAAIWP
jgi:hypothetical protein